MNSVLYQSNMKKSYTKSHSLSENTELMVWLEIRKVKFKMFTPFYSHLLLNRLENLCTIQSARSFIWDSDRLSGFSRRRKPPSSRRYPNVRREISCVPGPSASSIRGCLVGSDITIRRWYPGNLRLRKDGESIINKWLPPPMDNSNSKVRNTM